MVSYSSIASALLVLPLAFTIAARLPRYCSPICACYRPRLPSLLPPELPSLAFAIAARVTFVAYDADVREARVYRLQGLQACYAGLGFQGRNDVHLSLP